jgi:hypothetical protein
MFPSFLRSSIRTISIPTLSIHRIEHTHTSNKTCISPILNPPTYLAKPKPLV